MLRVKVRPAGMRLSSRDHTLLVMLGHVFHHPHVSCPLPLSVETSGEPHGTSVGADYQVNLAVVSFKNLRNMLNTAGISRSAWNPHPGATPMHSLPEGIMGTTRRSDPSHDQFVSIVSLYVKTREMPKCVGWAARDATGCLAELEFERRECGPNDVHIKILYCGSTWFKLFVSEIFASNPL